MGAEIRDVAAEVADRLRRRGVLLRGDERPEELASLLTRVERFEAAVQARGGDLMVDDLSSSEPDDRHFVLPPRFADESVADYIARIDAAIALVRAHPDITPA
ncbi:MAG TPA: hypothetical protein VFM23_09835 [Gemmatimonadales bacterium]|nr:hypothetical protein [Gemmatimonadales bacterium]